MTRVALLGGGKMGAALVGGLLDARLGRRRHRDRRGRQRAAQPRSSSSSPKVRVVPSAAWAVADADVVVVAVKPGDVAATLETALPALGADTLVLSIAAGVTIATLEALVPDRPVVRAMPNTPALVGEGASAIAPGTHAGAEHLDLAEQLLGAVGIVVRVGEPALDAVTGLSGSGPAYVFLVAEAMIEAGVLVGLAARRRVAARRPDAARLGHAAGAGRSGPEALRAAVTSPGGTTAAGSARARSARLARRDSSTR